MTSKTLTAPSGDRLTVQPDFAPSESVFLCADDADYSVTAGPFDSADLIAAIREVAGETSCDAVSPGGNYRCTRERGHITEHVATMFDGEVCDTWPVEADDKPEPAPSKSPTAEDFAKAEFARHEYGRIAARTDYDHRPWRVHDPTMNSWYSDADMAAEGWRIVTPAEDSISRAELDARLARRDEAHKRRVTRMQRHIKTLQGHLTLRRKQMDEMREQMEAMIPAPSTPRELLAMLPGMCWEPEGDEIPAGAGFVRVFSDGTVTSAAPLGLTHPLRAGVGGVRYLLLDPPAPATPEWHSARIVEATCRGRVGQWARTATDGLWVSLDGESREAYTPDLSDVTVVVPEGVEER